MTDNYPAGASTDPHAPYNVVEREPVTRTVAVDVVLHKEVELETTNYTEGVGYDVGGKYVFYDIDTSWRNEYEQQEIPVLDLLAELKKYADAELDTCKDNARIDYLKGIIRSINGWNVTDIETRQI